jgi:hypothetical protein
MTTPKARIAHAAPGRVRVRLTNPKIDEKGAAAHFENLGRELVKCPQVSAVSPRPRTGSLVVLHHGNFDTVRQFARERGLFDAQPARHRSHTVLGQIRIEVSRIDKQIRAESHGRFGLDTVAFYALLATGGYQALRGHFLPAAAALFLNAATWVPHESTAAPAPMP